jgi:RNA polymerase sigma-70 factor (ECF subfamily)
MPALSDEFISLVKQVQPTIQVYTQYVAWKKDDIEDIFNISLTNAFRKFHTFKKGSNFKAWILKFFTFTAYNINRRYEKQRAHEVLDEAQSIVNYASGQDELGKALTPGRQYDCILDAPPELSRGFQKALLSVSVRKRSIFLLRTVGQLTYQEIAVLLQVPKTTVMIEIFRVRSYLRKVLCEWQLGVHEKDQEVDNDTL